MFLKSNKLCLFDCKVCNHTFSSALFSVVNGHWCPYCSVPCQKVCSKEECVLCTSKTMISIPEIKEIWSEKNTKKPHEVLLNSHTNIWIKCQDQKCNHHYEITPNAYNGSGRRRCTYCCVGSNIFCIQTKENITCDSCFKRCFGSHPRSIHWNYEKNGTKTPYNIAKNHTEKCWFDCPDCKGIYETSPNNIVNRGVWCNCVRNKTETLVYNFLIEIYGCDNVKKEFSNKM